MVSFVANGSTGLKKGETMPVTRIMSTAVITLLSLLAADMLLQSPYQVWLMMATLGVVTGFAHPKGQRHVITGFGLGITLTIIREAITYGPLIKVTAPVFLAGYLFAIATSLAVRTIFARLKTKAA